MSKLPLFVLVAVLTLTACSSPELSTSQGLPVTPQILSELRAAAPVDAPLDRVAATFAFNGKGTDLQRETLTRELVGQVVEWDIAVYEVARDGEGFRITSQSVALDDPDAVNLVHVLAFVHASTESETAAIHAIQTGDPIRLRGRVRDIFLRSTLVLDPAVMVPTADAKASTVSL